MKKPGEMNLTLVAFYGPKRAELKSLIGSLKGKLASKLGPAFEPYYDTQVHATIVGLEGRRIGRKVLNTNYMELRGLARFMDLRGLVRLLGAKSERLFTVQIGRFRKDLTYPFASRGQDPYCRSFGVRGRIAVGMGWPVEDGTYPMHLEKLRRSLNKCGILHKYHQLADQLDNDLFFVLGRIDRRKVSKSAKKRLQKAMREYMAKELDEQQLVVRRQDLSIVAYSETTLNPRQSAVYSLESFEKHIDEAISLYRPVGE